MTVIARDPEGVRSALAERHLVNSASCLKQSPLVAVFAATPDCLVSTYLRIFEYVVPSGMATSHFRGVPRQADGGDQRRFLAVQRVKKVA